MTIIQLLEKYGATPTDWRHFLQEFDEIFVERELLIEDDPIEEE